MPRDEIVRALVDGEMLSGWSEPDARHLAQAMMWQEVRDGAMIVEQGAARGRDTRGAYLIVSGAVDVLTRAGHSTEEVHLARLGEREWFGVMGLIEEQPRAATCRAHGPTALGVLPRSAFRYLFTQNADVASRFQVAIAKQLARDLRRAATSLGHGSPLETLG